MYVYHEQIKFSAMLLIHAYTRELNREPTAPYLAQCPPQLQLWLHLVHQSPYLSSHQLLFHLPNMTNLFP